MKKFITAVITTAVLLGTTVTASAHGPRHRDGFHAHRGHGHHHRNFNPAPFIAGAIGMAIIGGILYDQYGRRCQRQVVYYDVYGNPVVQTVCE